MKIEGKVYRGFFGRLRGLMFSPKRTVIFDMGSEKRTPLHTFFVFFSINVYFLNENKEVVEKKEDLRPFTTYFPRKRARYIVESPEKLNIGNDKMEF